MISSGMYRILHSKVDSRNFTLHEADDTLFQTFAWPRDWHHLRSRGLDDPMFSKSKLDGMFLTAFRYTARCLEWSRSVTGTEDTFSWLI